jgi:aryl-alcohol dehydrogenase-like predicted oxidoreductase
MASDDEGMTDRIRLGRSDLDVPRLGMGAMTWGSPSGRSRWEWRSWPTEVPSDQRKRLIEQERVLPIPGAKNGRQAASNAEALSFLLAGAEIEALDQATTAWRR